MTSKSIAGSLRLSEAMLEDRCQIREIDRCVRLHVWFVVQRVVLWYRAGNWEGRDQWGKGIQALISHMPSRVESRDKTQFLDQRYRVYSACLSINT